MQAKDFLRMFAYDDWANRECLTAMRAANPLPAETIGRMAHILSAQKLWLERILKQPQSLPVWPGSTIDDCAELADEMSLAWQSYLTRGTEPDGDPPGGTTHTSPSDFISGSKQTCKNSY